MTEKTMRSVSQRNPSDPANVFGRVFRRGPTVATDGGEREGAEDADEETDEERSPAEQKMKDVDQTPPNEADDVNRVWERGGEPPVPETAEE
ncbi:hypothetical protein [Halobacterium wangiae]|uniref:hypothetical protein n=1 Tax=Halobacterium wangiae TaxID=2902623 RepID=UPI001E5651D8|nr:hypothetical protein [Halobacterium wangiae]